MRLSAFMGMLVMVVCFPLPGYIATIIRKIQQERMKRVIGVVILRSIMTNDSIQSDARVQAVTESKFIDANKMDRLAKRYLSAMSVVRMVKLFGWESNMKERIDEKREEELVYAKKRQIMARVNGIIKYTSTLNKKR